MTGTPLASLPDGLRHKLADAVRAYRERQPKDDTVRVILDHAEAAHCCVVGQTHRLRLVVAVATNRPAPDGPVQAVYSLEPLG